MPATCQPALLLKIGRASTASPVGDDHDRHVDDDVLPPTMMVMIEKNHDRSDYAAAPSFSARAFLVCGIKNSARLLATSAGGPGSTATCLVNAAH